MGVGGSPAMTIGIIRSGPHQIFSGQISVKIFDSIDHGGITLKGDLLFQTIVENGGDQRFLLGEGGFFFDDGGQDHGFPFGDSQLRGPLARSGSEDFFELMDHHLDHFLRVHFPEQVIGVGEEVAFQGRLLRVERGQER